MKKGVLFSLLLLPLMLMAAPVTQEQAMQKAREFMTGRQKMAKGTMLKAAPAPLKMQSAQTTASYYIFNVGEQQGFVVVSGDDRTPAILGYSDSGSIDASTMPANMKAWLEGYERDIKKLNIKKLNIKKLNIKKFLAEPSGEAERNIKNSDVPSPFTLHPSPISNHAPIAPLIKSTWGQEEPYNDLCPMDPYYNLKSPTGCTATAMAQIMNYYKYPKATIAEIPAYTTESYGLQMKAIAANTIIDWDNILDHYDKRADADQKQAVALLMQLCGQGSKMNYNYEGSGAYLKDATRALYKYFGYDKHVRYLERYDYRAAEWDDIIYNELQEHRPVLYSGFTVYDGHSFVIDGYDHDGLFHVNWGWDGGGNGYFLLSVLDPELPEEESITPDGFWNKQQAIVGIQKPTEKVPADVMALVTRTFEVSSTDKVFQRQADGTFVIPVYEVMYNQSPETRSYDLGCTIYNAAGEKVKDVLLYTQNDVPAFSMVSTQSDLVLPASLTDGKYTIKACSKLVGTDEWQIGVNDFVHSIVAVIDGDVVTTDNYGNIDLSGTIVSTTEQPTIGGRIQLEATLTNHGENFSDLLWLSIDGETESGCYADLESGETATTKLSYTPTRSGDNVVTLSLDEEQTKVIARSTIHVLGSETPELWFDVHVKDLRKNYSVPHTDIDVTLDIHNNSRYAYNDSILITLYKYNDEDNWDKVENKQMAVVMEAGADSLIQTRFEGLENYEIYGVKAFFHDAEGNYQNTSGLQIFYTNESADGKEDMTYMIENANFERGSRNWVIDAAEGGNVAAGGLQSNKCFEAYNNSQFDIHQSITGLPAGIYEIQVQGFYRNRRDIAAWNAWQNGTINVPVFVYLDNSTTPLKNVFEEPANAGFYSSGYYVSPTGLYFPNDMASAATAFSAGMYRQSVYGMVMSENDEVRIGVKGSTNQNNDSWAIWDNFKLTYMGFDVQYVRPALQQAIATAESLMAQMMSKGAYEQLSSVLAEAKAAEQTTDGEQMFQMLSRLYTVSDEAVASAANFLPLAAALDELQWALNNYHVASAAVQQQAADMLAEITAKGKNHEYADGDVEGLVEQINAMAYKLRIPDGMELASATNPVECTSLLDCPSFERDGQNSVAGWWGMGNFDFGNDELQRSALALEIVEGGILMYQAFDGIPNGYYAMQVSSFYRHGTPDQDAEYYSQGNTPESIFIFMGNPKKEESLVIKHIKLMSSEYATERLSNGDEWRTKEGYYVPNDMVAAVAYFKAGHYQNTLLLNVTDSCLLLGFNKKEVVENDWLMLDDFRLFYYGTEEPSDQTVGIKSQTSNLKPQISKVYDLQGRRVSASQKGLVISREQQPDGSVVVRKIVK